MKAIIFGMLVCIGTCIPKFASAVAKINWDVDYTNYIPVKSWDIVSANSPYFDMNDFVDNEEYKIDVDAESPYIMQNLQMAVGFTTIGDDAQFTYTAGLSFRITGYLNAGTSQGLSQPIVCRIYRKNFGVWDWQSTFIYYINTTCITNANFTPGSYPILQGEYEASNNVTASTQAYPAGNRVELDGGASVVLEPGFYTNLSSGGYVLAVIDGCSGTYRTFNPHSLVPSLISGTETKTGKITENENVKIYPNPVMSQLTIELDKNYADKDLRLELKDITGKIVYSTENPGSPSVFINMEKLDNGIYFLFLNSNSKTLTKKIVKE